MQEIAQRPLLFQELDITDGAALQELFGKVRAGAAVPCRAPGAPRAGRKGGAALLWAMGEFWFLLPWH